ncbi:MAG: hypothetical protein IT463_11995 [Planctomycetes bacterium]|nr:hypothetical protein [Planctomycetota bacterium]
MRLNLNTAAAAPQQALRAHQGALGTALQRISTGLRVNSPKDGPGRYVRAEALEVRFKGLHQALENTQSARHTFGVAQEVLGQIHDQLIHLRGLATQAIATPTADRDGIVDNAELALATIQRLAQGAEFNGRKLFTNQNDFGVEGVPEGVFRELDVRTARLSPDRASENFRLDITQLAERARLETDFVFGGSGYGVVRDVMNQHLALNISGDRGATVVNADSNTRLTDLVASINAAAEVTGVYASSYAVFGTELATGPLGDTQWETAGGTFSIQVTANSQTVTVNGTATGDGDGDTQMEVTGADLERALNDAGLGHFTVEAHRDDTGAPTQRYYIRHAGTDPFTLVGLAGAFSTLNASSSGLGAATLHGEAAAGAIGLAAGTEFRFNISFEDATDPSRLNTRLAVVRATGGGGAYVTAKDLADGLNAAAGTQAFAVQVLGNANGTLNAWGQAPAFRVTAIDPALKAFSITESELDGDGASLLGLQAYSGGGRGFGSRAFGAMALLSHDHGSREFVRLSPAQEGVAGFGTGGPLGGTAQAFGRDVQVMLEGRRVTGDGLEIAAASPRISLRAVLSSAASRDTLTANLRFLARAIPGDASDLLVGLGVATAALDGSTTGSVAHTVRPDAAALGIYDSIDFALHQFDPVSPEHRHGLTVQLGDSNSPHDRFTTRLKEIGLNTLGSQARPTPGSDATEYREGREGGFLRDVLSGGEADFWKDPARAARIIDRAIEQVLEERTFIGGIEQTVLQRTEGHLAQLADLFENAWHDTRSADLPGETAAVARAQMGITAATFALRTANGLHAGILDLLR